MVSPIFSTLPFSRVGLNKFLAVLVTQFNIFLGLISKIVQDSETDKIRKNKFNLGNRA